MVTIIGVVAIELLARATVEVEVVLPSKFCTPKVIVCFSPIEIWADLCQLSGDCKCSTNSSKGAALLVSGSFHDCL